jgi:DNA-binding GntR family transcriptional regulator
MAKGTDIRERIVADIASGTIQFGDRLTIDELARRYQASHMPVREALRELHGLGLVRQGVGKSMQLVTFDRALVENLFDTRSAIEVLLTRLATQHMTPGQVEQLQAMQEDLERLVDRGDDEGVLAANRRFHSAIYSVANNPEAVAIVERHWLFIRLAWSRIGFAPLRYVGVVNDHRHLLKALSNQDVEAAGILMGAHVIKAKHDMLEQMARHACLTS